MPELVFYNPANPKQQYRTIIPNDPNVPAGYLDSQGRDGAIPEKVKVYTAGVNNQGAGGVTPGPGLAGVTDADPQQRIDQPKWPNGILNGYGGGYATEPVGVIFQMAGSFYDDLLYDTYVWD